MGSNLEDKSDYRAPFQFCSYARQSVVNVQFCSYARQSVVNVE